MLVIILTCLLVAIAICRMYRNWGGSLTTPNDTISISVSNDLVLFFKLAAIIIASRLALYCIVEMSYAFRVENYDISVHIGRALFRWDTYNYLRIAEQGYTHSGKDKYDLAFLPLYPFLISILAAVPSWIASIIVLEHEGLSWYISGILFCVGLIISNASLILACFYLYKLILFEYDSEILARRTLKYLLIFPFTLFTALVYTESLFLFLSIGCFYYMRRANWLAAGLMGLLASCTKNQGILLFLPLLYEIYHSFRLIYPSLSIKKRLQHLISYCLSLILVLSGFAVYLGINKYVSGDWLMFVRYQQENWHGSFGFFADNIRGIIEGLLGGESKTFHSHFPAVLLFYYTLIGIVVSVQKVPVSYTLYSIVYLIFSFSPTWLLAGPRYILCLFPLHLISALLVNKHKKNEQILDVVMLVFLVFYCIEFSKNNIL